MVFAINVGTPQAYPVGTKVKIGESSKGESDYRRFFTRKFDKKTEEAIAGEVQQTLGDGRVLVLFPQGTCKCAREILVRA